MKENNPLQIKELLTNYCLENFDLELKSFVLLLLDTIVQNPLMDISRGSPTIWAASIVYIIARLNFLFDEENEEYISYNELCDYFEVKKSTIGSKATLIEKTYGIVFADKNYTKPSIRKSFKFYRTPEGFIMPALMLEPANEEESKEIERFQEAQKLADQERLEKKKARRTEINRKIAEGKRKEREAGQIGLFD